MYISEKAGALVEPIKVAFVNYVRRHEASNVKWPEWPFNDPTFPVDGGIWIECESGSRGFIVGGEPSRGIELCRYCFESVDEAAEILYDIFYGQEQLIKAGRYINIAGKRGDV